jgi:hypothetical protein
MTIFLQWGIGMATLIRQPTVQIGVIVGAGFPRPGRGDLAPTSFIADGPLHH